jgi:hypothetical protein
VDSLKCENRARILNFKGAKKSIPQFTSLWSLAGRYDKRILTRFLTPTDCYKIPALALYTLCPLLPGFCYEQDIGRERFGPGTKKYTIKQSAQLFLL